MTLSFKWFKNYAPRPLELWTPWIQSWHLETDFIKTVKFWVHNVASKHQFFACVHWNTFSKVPKAGLRIKMQEMVEFWQLASHTFVMIRVCTISLDCLSFTLSQHCIHFSFKYRPYSTHFRKLRQPKSPCQTLSITHKSVTLNFVLHPFSIHFLC